MRKLIFQIFLLLSLAVAVEKPYVLMVSFDGFRFDYMTWADTPHFDYIKKIGVKADGLIPVNGMIRSGYFLAALNM